MTKTVNDYLSLPYTKVVRRDEEGDFIARVKEFSGCLAHGSTEAESLEFLADVMTAWIEDRLQANLEIPLPEEEETLPSGKWLQRVSRSLHGALIQLARSEDVSLNQLVTTVLAEAVGRGRSVAVIRREFEASGANAGANPGNWAPRRPTTWRYSRKLSSATVNSAFLVQSMPRSGKQRIGGKRSAYGETTHKH